MKSTENKTESTEKMNGLEVLLGLVALVIGVAAVGVIVTGNESSTKRKDLCNGQ